jgi:pimeloyl-ACP methyl ester carboxylesterase
MTTASVPYDGPKLAAANGLSLCYDTFGSPDDPPLVLIMGLATQMIVWDEDFCAELASRGRYVIRFDNRDIGGSTRLNEARPPSMVDVLVSGFARSSGRARYTLLDMAKDTIGLLDALGIASAHVVGISMGGAIGQEIAIAFPSRIRTLTSIMSSTGDTKLPPPTMRALGVLFARPAPDRESYLRQYVKTWKTLNGERFPFDPERTRRQGERAYERGPNPAAAARQMLAIVASGNRRAALGKIATPTLVIHGTNDPLVRYPAAPDLARAIPGAKLLAIEGMGHTLPRAAWPQIIDAIAAHTAAS